MAYFWFHAFRAEDDVQRLLTVLSAGPTPRLGGQTEANEARLGIAPPCVYAYLGQTLEEFGECALCIGEDSLTPDAVLSPFDTGGLVAHLVPVSGWDEERRRAFLRHYSWPSNQLPALLAAYPTADAARISAYLRGERPPEPGPHIPFPPPAEALDDTRVAAIWANATSNRAWLWEARSPNRLDVGARLVHWSCSPSIYQRVLEHSEGVLHPNEATRIAALLAMYVPGGVSVLCDRLLGRQEAA